MKKYFIFVIAFAVMLFVVGCNNEEKKKDYGKNSNKTEETYDKNFYGRERKEYKPNVDSEVDEAVVIAKEWYNARCVEGNLLKEFDLLSESAKQGATTREEYASRNKQESDRVGWIVKKETNGEPNKVEVEKPDSRNVIVHLYTPDGKAVYGIWVIKEAINITEPKDTDPWKVNKYGRADL